MNKTIYHRKTPAVSWKLQQDCPNGAQEYINVTACGKELMVSVIESYTTEKHKWIGKEVMLCLNKDAANQISDYLKEWAIS